MDKHLSLSIALEERELADRHRPFVKIEKWDFQARLRRRATPAELRLWGALREGRLIGTRWHFQTVLFGYIADFYCDDAKLIVELDGAYHLSPKQAEWDAKRDRAMKEHGIRTLRITNDELEADPAGTLHRIWTEMFWTVADTASFYNAKGPLGLQN